MTPIRNRGAGNVWLVVGIGLLAVIGVFVVPYLVWVRTHFTGTDEGLRKHLSFEVAATEAMIEDRVSIALRFEAQGKSVVLDKRPVVVFSDGREIRGRACTGPLEAEQTHFTLHLGVNDGQRDIYYWHVPLHELDDWLGGAGKHVIEMQVGPVKSNPISITLPGPIIESPDFEHTTR